jgi:small subunit ribosomal protein S4
MARYTGPKHKLARREGVNILGKVSPSLDRRLNVLPGQKGRSRYRKKVSEYGMQLREKQKLKRIYGLLERQFSNYVAKAEKDKDTSTDEGLLRLLETRLDNVTFRLGFASTRSQARQYVTHGHIFVNGKKVNIPSYKVFGR